MKDQMKNAATVSGTRNEFLHLRSIPRGYINTHSTLVLECDILNQKESYGRTVKDEMKELKDEITNTMKVIVVSLLPSQKK
jgi:hypothetical protein